MKRVGGIVPAAGLSRRMGREKILLRFGGTTALERVLEGLRVAGVSDRVVVLRPDLKEAIALAEQSKAQVVINPHPEEEMLVSIRMGMAALPPATEAFFVWPSDHPAVSAETLFALCGAGAPDHVAIPVYCGQRGHPALVGTGLTDEIFRIPPGFGLRDLWHKRPEILRELDVEDRGVILDINTPEDYEEAIGSPER